MTTTIDDGRPWRGPSALAIVKAALLALAAAMLWQAAPGHHDAPPRSEPTRHVSAPAKAVAPKVRPIERLAVGDRVLAAEPDQDLGDEVDEVPAGGPTWLRYPPDSVLPEGLSIEVTDGRVTAVATGRGPQPGHDLIGSRYVVGDVDATDVTPALWRAFALEMEEEGGVAEIALARPLWWVERTGAGPGVTVPLGLKELDLSGTARVVGVGPCRGDSRGAPAGVRVVTGTIAHRSGEVLDIDFRSQGGVNSRLGVTATHPIYSEGRSGWVAAGELAAGERVRTLGGTAVVAARAERPSPEAVYNLEVHRSHTYHVSKIHVLSHNMGVNNYDDAATIASKAAQGYKNGQCKPCATSIVGALKQKGLKGEILNMRALGPTGQPSLHNIYSDSLGANISTNGFHQAVRVGDIVFDNINPNGIHYDQWVKDLVSPFGYKIDTAPF